MDFGFGSGWHLARIEWTKERPAPDFAGCHPQLDAAIAFIQAGDYRALAKLTSQEAPDGRHDEAMGTRPQPSHHTHPQIP
ncbi:MAG: hypothetical protein AAF732_19335 [Pseudomonadota bacterium]